MAKPPGHLDLFDPDSDETLYGKAVELDVPLWSHPKEIGFALHRKTNAGWIR